MLLWPIKFVLGLVLLALLLLAVVRVYGAYEQMYGAPELIRVLMVH